ncbi:selenocysteine-specific translation elongation factor [Vagococcus lutrae]|uniref:selenocysteine-specific translation elongation factor n=1 Tax=Vagococcus lutrae TaxID=81947 RepID=UPI001C95DA2C|nr:selenocysteine-specific translation elongation factor [Vagococcus lutrae]QZN89379.1 selenocysteine-specific translation elongation factor [Vagococcus lutrae]
MNDFIIGTAGHVDHGKTSLIKALTDIDTDRTPQEKKRGLSIELGFAYMDLSTGQRVGIVDVPGHESFLKNMVSGAIGMDLVLLVVDVNEGIMPQTYEHLSILKLLGIEDMIVVITKVNEVSIEKITSCRTAIEHFLTSFGFNNEGTQVPVIPVDSLANTGIGELKAEIEKYARHFARKNEVAKLPRLNVDRSFSLKGIGTIVTGTLLSGRLAINDEIWVYPLRKKVKIRQLHVHDQPVSQVTTGQRVAIQLSGVKVSDVPKGSVLSCVENVEASYMLNTYVTNIQSQATLTHWQRVHLHVGTQTIQGRVVPLNQEEIAPDESDFVQLRLEQPVIVFPGDRFILRSYSPVTTIAGGIVLNTTVTKSRRNDQFILEELTYRLASDNKKLVLFLLKNAGEIVSFQSLSERSQMEELALEQTLSQLEKDGQIMSKSTSIITKERFTLLKQELIDYLDKLYETNQRVQGVTLTDLFRVFVAIPSIWIEAILEDLITDGTVVKQEDIYMLPREEPHMEVEWLRNLDAFLNQQGLKATTWQTLKEKFPDIALLDSKERQSYIYFVDRQHVVGVTYLNHQIERVIDYLEKNRTISVAECRDLLDVNRQQSLQLLEAMDKQGWTKRVDNQRLLIKKRR